MSRIRIPAMIFPNMIPNKTKLKPGRSEIEPGSEMSLVSGKYHEPEEPYRVNLASAEAEIRHVTLFSPKHFLQ